MAVVEPRSTHYIDERKTKLRFDRISRTRDGMLCGVELVPRINEAELEGELAFDAIDSASGGEGT